MFKPVPMRWVSAVVLEKDERVVLRMLGALGNVHLARVGAGPERAPLEARDRSAELARCDQLLARTAELRRSLTLQGERGDVEALAEPSLDCAEETLKSLEQGLAALAERREQHERCRGDASTVSDRLSAFGAEDFPLDTDRFTYLHFVLGSLPVENLKKVQEACGNEAVFLPQVAEDGRMSLVALTGRHTRAKLEEALRHADFQREAAVAGMTVQALLENSRRDAGTATAALASLEHEMGALSARAARSLEAIETCARTERQFREAQQTFSRTEMTVLLTGWAPAADVPALQRRLRDTTGGRCVVEITAPEDLPRGEPIPVLLRHVRWLGPFARLVTLYGLPSYGEVAPTLFVAMSYLLMFGMMFGDVGHGAVLMIGGVVALFAARSAAVRDMGILLACAGLASAIFGVLYGSYFGITQLKPLAVWRDPLEGNLLELMVIAMGIGVGMISLGLVLNIINHLLRGEFIQALMDKFGVAGLLFYWGGLLLVAKYATLQKAGLITGALVAFVALPVAAWILKQPMEQLLRRRAKGGHVEGGWFTLLAESVVEAFEAILVYLANTVSFVRLAAYAMTHAALLMATFLMAAAVQNGTALGEGLGVLIIILGNLAAIVLEGIVASVQTVRLEYYEFFSKFFSGEGRPFKPFCLVVKGVTP